MLALLLPASASAEQATRIIVQHDPGLSSSERRDIRTDADVRLVDTMLLPRTEVVATPAGEAQQALSELNRDPDVVFAQIDHRRTVSFDRMPRQWALENTAQSVSGAYVAGLFDADVDAPEAWAQNITGTAQHVAVIDTGVDDGLADLNGQVYAKRTFIGDGPDVPDQAEDGDSHGTHVSGIIAARRNDNDTNDGNEGIVGVAPDAKLMALKALGDDGAGYDSDIADAMVYAGAQGVRVANLSLGGSDAAPALEAAIQTANQTLFVVAAGNDGTDNDNAQTPSWPCNFTEANVICVGASTNNDRVADFSNYGEHSVDLFAPGYQILSTVPPGTFSEFPASIYGYLSGTSMAAPHVAAAAALILEVKPSFTIQDVRDLILATVDHRDAFAHKSATGGRLNVGAAVAFARSSLTLSAPDDTDGDNVIDAIDSCPNDPMDPVDPRTGTDGCTVRDTDDDDTDDLADNCPGIANDQAADDDGDGEGNACDDSPRGPDVDGDGKPALDDACPTVSGTDSNGCPPPVVTPTPTPTPTPNPGPIDSDSDGISNASDGCPYEYAKTNNGCPLPSVTSLSARAKTRHGKRSATISVRSSRAAAVEVTIQRKVCKHKHCRWVRVSRKNASTVSGRATVTATKLKRGSYRAIVVLSSSAGRAKAETQHFRVR